MPNLRIVYRLELSRRGELECSAHSTPLMKWDAINPTPIRFESLFSNKYAETLETADRPLVMRLRANCRAQENDVARLSGREGHELFKQLVATQRAFWAKGSHLRLKWDDAPMPVRLDWAIGPGEFRPVLIPADSEATILPLSPPIHLLDGTNLCGPVQNDASNETLLSEWAGSGKMDSEKARNFCLRLLNTQAEHGFPIPTDIEVKEAEKARVLPELTLSRSASGGGDQSAAVSLNELVRVDLHFRYGKRRIEPNSELDWISYTGADQGVVRVPRDRDFEAACTQRLEQLGFEIIPSQSYGELLALDAGGYQLSEKAPTTWAELLDQVFPQLEASGWTIRQSQGFKLNAPGQAEFYSQVSARQSWFEYAVGLRYKGVRFSAVDLIADFIRSHSGSTLSEIEKKLLQSNLALPLEDGEFLVLPGKLLRNVVHQVFELLGHRKAGDPLKLSRWRVAELAEKGILEAPQDCRQNLPDMGVLLRYMSGESPLKAREAPAALQAALRDYQKFGLAWLQFLRESGTHGILADDMGLGKTLQTIACLLLEKSEGRLNGPSLIVAPTSVLDNWRNEIERFAPQLECLLYYGNERKALQAQFTPGKIVITSYAVLRNDVALLAETDWHYLVVDEAQFIKNPQSQAARSLCQLPARHKLCLSGTPIENRLAELWSLFHFLMPDLLGPYRVFQQSYAREIEADTNAGHQLAAQLRTRIQPFILRRKKEHVAAELPDKTEIIRPIELSEAQSESYESVRAAMNRKISKELEERGLAASKMVVLDALLKLRQICCDPRLYHKTSEPLPSAKLETALELIDTLLANGHRILLFSQFTSMLELIEAELSTRKIDFRTLTGATQNRGALVEAFQNEEFPVFLISLKAGGTGLNLTAADAIIHYDPWWNPAAEAQATDRSHRIGQEKPVFVYKLIAESTVEAKILELQKQKGKLAADLLDQAPETALSQWTEEAILELFN